MTSTDSGPAQHASLTGRTLSGLRWSYLAAASSAVVQVGYVAAMSRLLDPRAFGLMAIANLAVSFGFYFARMGLAQALIQRERITTNEVRAATTSGWLLGGTCAGVLWLTAPQVAHIFSEPDAVPLLRAMGVSLLFSGLSMTSQALLRRSMRFRELSLIQMGCAIIGAAVGVASAIAGAGVWSLVLASLASSIMHFVLQYWRVRHPIRPLWRLKEFRSLYKFGIRISLINLGEFAGTNLDTLAVGRIVSTTSLGLYNRAFFLVNLPVTKYLSHSLSTVLFPGFSRVQAEPERVRRVYLSVVRLASVILFPVCAGMAVAGREVVLVALGGQWVAAIPLVPLFALAAGLNIMSKLSELLAEARSKLNSVIALQYGYLAVLGAFLVVAAMSGGELWMFAAALAAGEIIRLVAYMVLIRSVTGVDVRSILSAYLPSLFAAAVVATAVGGARMSLVQWLSPMPLLGFEVLAGAIGLALGIRLSPSSAVRREIGMRLRGAGLIGPDRVLMTRLSGLLLGRQAAKVALAAGTKDQG